MPLMTLDTPSTDVADLMISEGYASNMTNGDDCSAYIEITEWCEAQLGGMANSTTRQLVAIMMDESITKPTSLMTSMALMICVPNLYDAIDEEMQTALILATGQNKIAAGMILGAFGATLGPDLHQFCVQNALSGIAEGCAEAVPGWVRHY